MFLTEKEAVDFIKETVYGVLCEIANANDKFVYHFTDFKSAVKIMQTDEMFLSRTTPSSVDLELSDYKLTYLSFTSDGNIQTSQYPLQKNVESSPTKINVRFSVDKNVISKIGKLKDVNFHLQKATDIISMRNQGKENTTSYKKKLEFFKKYGLSDDFSDSELLDLAKKMSTNEKRFLNDTSSIKDFSKYVAYADFLITPFYYGKFDIEGVARMLSTMPKWRDKIRIFSNEEDFDERENYQTIQDVISGKEEKLTSREEAELRKISKNYMNEKTLIAISKLFYVMNYSSKGFEYTIGNAERMLTRLFGNTTIIITSATEKEYGDNSIIKDAILSHFDEIGRNLDCSKINTLFTDTKNIFVQLSQNLATCRFVLSKIIDAYSEWLKKYQNSVDKKANDVQNELNSVSVNNISQIINFATKNIYIFELVCKKYFEKSSDAKANKITTYLNSLLEGRGPKMTITELINDLIDILGVDGLKKELKRTYMNKIYHYDEMIYFKRSVMLYRNNFITKIRRELESGTFSRVGDLAVLYNNAGQASSDNDL